MASGVFLGTFDPIHNGHLAMIRTALRVVDRVFVVMGNNPKKSARGQLLSLDERVEVIRTLFPDGRVVPQALEEDFVGQVRRNGAELLLQGLRSPEDAVEGWPYVTSMLEKAPDLLTVFVHSKMAFSSTRVRELLAEGRYEELGVPEMILERLIARHQAQGLKARDT
jgi:pantetheine-phosphate adenylyltransferase